MSHPLPLAAAAAAASSSSSSSSSSALPDDPPPRSQQHHRRRSSASVSPSPSTFNRRLDDRPTTRRPAPQYLAVAASHVPPSALSPILGTPSFSYGMTPSRSSSPLPGGGWSSPGLTSPGLTSPGLTINTSAQSSPRGIVSPAAAAAKSTTTNWEPARARNPRASYPSFSAHNQGFFTRHMRRISSSLPRFATHTSPAITSSSYTGDKGRDKPLLRAPSTLRNVPLPDRLRSIMARLGRKWKLRALSALLLLFALLLFYHTPLLYTWRRTWWLGGGQKYVIILAANVGGGVMEWKGAREWAIERDSVRNKKKYVHRWGYDLEIVDMSTKKRYAHEWRESWEKVDFIRNTLRKYPRAEWIWWLDLNTFIMEPSYSLQDHIFKSLGDKAYRDINEFNPLNITHPLNEPYLDAASLSAVGDGQVSSINVLLSQDCSGFNLGSFFIRRGVWTDRLLDVWWDPVAYEQKHMDWAHKEQDALEQLYTAQPWLRRHTAFLPQRMINSFPEGACGEHGNDSRIHYDRRDRDFVVNMAGCEWGRDCWGEMYNFRELSYYLNRSWWERFKEDLVAVLWYRLTGKRVKL